MLLKYVYNLAISCVSTDRLIFENVKNSLRFFSTPCKTIINLIRKIYRECFFLKRKQACW